MPATVYIPGPPLEIPDQIRDQNANTSSTDTAGISKVEDSTLKTVDDLLRQRAARYPDKHIVSYPRSGVQYVNYTLRQLDVFAWRAANWYSKSLPSRKSSLEKPSVIALLGPSNLEYLITLLALTKLGHSVLFLSTRLSIPAVESLMKTTSANTIIGHGRHLSTAVEAQKLLSGVEVLEMSDRSVFEYPIEAHGNTQLDAHLDPEVEQKNIAFIIHSSGSTGLPKPIYQTQKSCLANYSFSMNMKAFITLPLFHNHGICNLFRAIYSLKSIHLYNAELPLTQEYLIDILSQHQFEIFYGVPYALKLLSETQKGIDVLRELKIVMYGGSACPDDLGDLLVENGVNLVSHYGATEIGQLMTSFRPEGDKEWNYVRETDKLSPYLYWKPHGTHLYECVVTDGWPSKVQSNQPDGSYATKDLFEAHPSIPRAWKYIARLDDTIVLVNGEKFNPVAMEGTIRSNKNVAEAVVFGAGRPYLGMLIVPAKSMAGKTDSEILDIIWPVVESANEAADGFAQISRAMIKLLPHNCEYPRTDKGSIIRQAFYRTYEAEVQEMYDAADINASGHGLQQMELPELRDFVSQLAKNALQCVPNLVDDEDLFTLGLDSLQAIQMRSEILKTVDVGGKRLGQNIVFENPSVEKLSRFLLGLRVGDYPDTSISVEKEMESLIEKYTNVGINIGGKPSAVVVTGATGSLGAHVVCELAQMSSIHRIYCLVRADDTSQAMRRVRSSLIQRKVYHRLILTARRKIFALPSDFAKPDLGLNETSYAEITSSLLAVIHCAWSVNFNMHLSSFEKGNVAGVCHLLSLCRSAQPPASMNFCSSVSTCSRATETPVPERCPNLEWAQGMGYAQSKSVAEHLCAKAADQGITTRVLRVGQIVGDSKHGVWNAQEALPMMMQTALTVGALPQLREAPSWLPVDVVGKAVVEIALSDAGSVFANVTNPHIFNWMDDLLPALRKSGLSFEEVEPKEWVRRLRESNPDPIVNPPIKLVDFFASKYDKELTEFKPSKSFTTDIACSLSPSLATAPVLNQDLVDKFVRYFLSTAWASQVTTATPKTVIVVAGPCGTGKTTIGTGLAQQARVPFIEGDSLHKESAVAKMRSGVALTEDYRMSWLDRIIRHSVEAVTELGYSQAVVSCSALTVELRRIIRRGLAKASIGVVFIDLQADRDVLLRRVQERTGHYMSAKMVDGQVELYKSAGDSEIDVLPVDSGAEKDVVLSEILPVLEMMKN